MRYVIAIVGLTVFGLWDFAKNDGNMTASIVAEVFRVGRALGL
jgi:hypothetical protein